MNGTLSILSMKWRESLEILGLLRGFSRSLFRSFTNFFHLLFYVVPCLVTGGGFSLRELLSILLPLR